MGKIIDITGQRFGNLVAISPCGKDEKRQIIWECACDCGSTAYIKGSLLRNGSVKSCGCGKYNQAEDLVGRKFGRLTVISRNFEKSGKRAYWNCECDCGTMKEVSAYQLKSGQTISCGCYKSEYSIKLHYKHGLSGHTLFSIWNGILDRCNNKNNKSYNNYGGRGITVCQEWMNDFQTFYDWAIANGYQKGLSIERIDNNSGYNPQNCKWATMEEQANNKRNNHLITYNGETLTIAEWSRRLGIPYRTLISRINTYGWTIKKAFNTK